MDFLPLKYFIWALVFAFFSKTEAKCVNTTANEDPKIDIWMGEISSKSIKLRLSNCAKINNHFYPTAIHLHRGNGEATRIYSFEALKKSKIGDSPKKTENGQKACEVQLDGLRPSSQYTVYISVQKKEVQNGTKGVLHIERMDMHFITFLSPQETCEELTLGNTEKNAGDMTPSELFLVALALILWGGSVTLFIQRWGKIRMLLPYHPDYREKEAAQRAANNNVSNVPRGSVANAAQCSVTVDYTSSEMTRFAAQSLLALHEQTNSSKLQPNSSLQDPMARLNDADRPHLYRRCASAGNIPSYCSYQLSGKNTGMAKSTTQL